MPRLAVRGRYHNKTRMPDYRLGDGTGTDTGVDPCANAADYSACWSANEPDGTEDVGDNSGNSDYGSVTGNSSAPQPGGANYWSTLMQQVGAALNPSGSSAPASGPALPSGQYQAPPASANAPASAPQSPGGGGFFDPSTCANSFCYQDLYDFSQPYPYIIASGLIVLLLMGSKK